MKEQETIKPVGQGKEVRPTAPISDKQNTLIKGREDSMKRQSNKAAVIIVIVAMVLAGLLAMSGRNANTTENLPKIHGLNGVQVF